MLKYEIKATQGKRIVPVVVFEDESYSLLNEFLLAERSFRRELLSLVNEVDLNMSQSESFSGNAFSLEIGKDTCKITNDTDDRELEVATADFKQVLLDYIYAIREIKVNGVARSSPRPRPSSPSLNKNAVKGQADDSVIFVFMSLQHRAFHRARI